MNTYRFTGFIEYAPKNDREWHFEKKTFTKDVESKSMEKAEMKLQILLMCSVRVPVKRMNLEYKGEQIK